MRSFIVLVVGFSGGWAIRSLADSPQGVGVTLLRVAHDAREGLGRWVARERERLEDMMAEARSDAGHGAARTDPRCNGVSSGRTAHRARA
jgi:hypothetical protein